jgi:1-acyl-sn-glycerol-3-phosphate acyltransferase
VVRKRQAGGAFRFAVSLLRPPLMAFTRRDWRGAENLPADGGFVVASNHVSHIDPLTLAHFLWDSGYPVQFLGKESVFRIPLAGRIIGAAGQIPVYRDTKDAGTAFSAAVAAVRKGACVGIYPEATLTRDPALWPMLGKTGAARVALTTGCPVIPVAQWGPQEILPPYAKRLHLFPRKTVHVWAGAPVDLSTFGGTSLDVQSLREATGAILADVTALLMTIRGEQAPEQRWDPGTGGLPHVGNPKRRSP